MTKKTSFRLSDDADIALSGLAERYNMSRTAVLELLILDRASVSNQTANAARRRHACQMALDFTQERSTLFLLGYNTGWVHFQTRHGDRPMIETLPMPADEIPNPSTH